ncbi:hypothetical protein [Novosphingobium sp. AP12]|uniref:hypothetical protein n=1 Tax=Novosphingobium sp. AP12 TaxID=1144305 RepID=UPI00027205E3|nr:hypothetical protein [Novosphingobium sp. AP12]EJL23967.1 hypothetical protein PMI02_03887 [Novosphingobium sp. AP12]
MSDIKFVMSKADGLTVADMETAYQKMAEIKRLRKLYDAPGHALPAVGGFSDQEMIEAVAPAYGQELLRRINDLVAQLVPLGFKIVSEPEAA